MLNPINLLSWNIKGASRTDSLCYLQKICYDNSVWLLALLEPMSNISQLEVVRHKLNFDHSTRFVDGRLLWASELQLNFAEYADQLVHASVTFRLEVSFFLLVVYAKCTRVGGRPISDAMESIGAKINLSWIVVGDFNVIFMAEERIGGLPCQCLKYGGVQFL